MTPGIIVCMIHPRLRAITELHKGDDQAPTPQTAAVPAGSGNVAPPSETTAGVPGPDQAPPGDYGVVGSWLSVSTTPGPAVTGTSPCFTVTHWHWMAAKGMVPPVPAELGVLLPPVVSSEAQLAHDLTVWEVLDGRGDITDEASQMFAAVSGAAALTLYGTVLLYAHRRAPVELPHKLKEFGLEAAVRNVPRVSFSIGVTGREVVTVVVNNGSVWFTRRYRRVGVDDDAAAALWSLLDPAGAWDPYPLATPITLPGEAVELLTTDPDTAGVIDDEPDEDAPAEQRAADEARRRKVSEGARRILGGAGVTSGSTRAIADIAAATTDALAQVVVRSNAVDIPRGEPAALAISFLRGKGVVTSHPVGSGRWRRTIVASGNADGITSGIAVLRRVVSGG